MDAFPRTPYTPPATTSPLQNGHHTDRSAASSRSRGGNGGINLTPGADSLTRRGSQPPRPSHVQHPPNASESTFRAPAHKHAHHLHSIPPREKSTRTLIIDHLLWVHACTRFAQARAELAMTDRTGGPGTPNYARRERPEQWQVDDEALPSDGELADVDGHALCARSGGPDHVHDDEEKETGKRIPRQDLPHARRLRQRAESLEKVIASMRGQPPRVIPFPEGEPTASVWQSSLTKSVTDIAAQQSPEAPSPAGKHVLPNGVRLRFALTAIINALFARQAPFHFQPAVSVLSSSGSTSSGRSSSRSTTQTLSSPSPSTPPSASLSWLPPSLVPLLAVSSAIVTAPSMSSPYSTQPSNLTYPTCQRQPFAIEPSLRVRDMFTGGVELRTTRPPLLPLCSRHLRPTCEICVNPGRGGHTRPRGPSHASERGLVQQGGRISGFAEGAGIGSGLAPLGPGGTLLRQGIPPLCETHLADSRTGTGVRSTPLTELIPHFVRLSALVALELGREVNVEELGPRASRAALVPTTHWYFLLAGILTRAALEGYLTAGWTGVMPVKVLLGVGLGTAAIREASVLRQLTPDDTYVESEPDGMPDLTEAVDVLFPSRGANASAEVVNENGNETDGGEGGKESDGSVAEYAREMGKRLARFLDVPASTPDLSTHLEDLTWQYPAEPVERAALRFCEALARWRGKPELETHKRPLPALGRTPAPTVMLEGGIGSTANSAVRRAIGRYFVIPHGTTTTAAAAAATTTPASKDDPSSGGEGEGRVVIGRKRAHSISGAAASNGNASTGDRWEERKRYA
ncbi:hypothetical protein F5148DRAFT_1146508 [Russula earlei]|uniref:Uncharacterized protein n=1 Tax=Russula earlei TaxID=71964 RepID=A0ACC0UJM5_9AGAM|nr:hypothetical protein F5148DRAFT_1146508 [Russula earlei]